MKHCMRRHAFLLYCSLLVTLAVLAAEFVLLPRAGGLPRETLLMGFAAQPGTVIDGQTINSMGFTGDVVSPVKPANTLRVLVLGSSTLFNRHMAEHLKTALQARTSQRVELVDAGIRSHTSRADLYKLQLLATYAWDYVLIYDGINDLWANHVLPEDYRSDYAQLDPWYQRNWLLDHSLLARYAQISLYWHINTFNKQWGEPLFRAYQFVFPKKAFVNAAQFSSVQSFANNLDAMVQRIREAGGKPVLMTFAFHLPANYTRQAFLDKQLDYSNPDNYDARDVFNWGPPDYVREGLTRENAAIRAYAQQQQLALIDMDALMSGHGQWFGDICHFNDDGVAIFADHVARTILPFTDSTPAP